MIHRTGEMKRLLYMQLTHITPCRRRWQLTHPQLVDAWMSVSIETPSLSVGWQTSREGWELEMELDLNPNAPNVWPAGIKGSLKIVWSWLLIMFADWGGGRGYHHHHHHIRSLNNSQNVRVQIEEKKLGITHNSLYR